MFFLIRSTIGTFILAASCYTVFFVDFAGETLSQHAQDIWHAPVVQKKLALLTNGVGTAVQKQLAHATRAANAVNNIDIQTLEALAEVEPKKNAKHKREFSEAERQALISLLQQAPVSP